MLCLHGLVVGQCSEEDNMSDDDMQTIQNEEEIDETSVIPDTPIIKVIIRRPVSEASFCFSVCEL